MTSDQISVLRTAALGVVSGVVFGLILSIVGPASLRVEKAQAQAAQGPVPRGRLIAERLCSYCHQTERDRSSVVEAAAPNFMEIANLPGRNADYLRRFTSEIHIVETLGDPKVPMPTALLTPESREDVIAYILSFQRDPATGRLPARPLRPFQ